MEYEITGSDLQVLEVKLNPQEGMVAEVGAMVYMHPDIQMNTNTGGGLFSGLSRAISGGGFFVSEFDNTGREEGAYVAFSAPYPGKISAVPLGKLGGKVLCQKDAFLCAEKGTAIGTAFTKRLGAGFFGGDGFILQGLEGTGTAFVHAGGALIKKELKPGEMIRCETGSLVGFTKDVDYNIEFVGGFKNTLFGGEGLFLATLRGPGIVLLQSLPISKLAERIGSSIGGDSSGGSGLLGKFLN